MPRTSRLDAPGLLHHVMIRGIEKTNIYTSNKDLEDFIERLETLCPDMGLKCYAWAFIPNHAHFLFQADQEPLSKFMRRLLTGYVIGFNRRHKRRGQLFQNRFKSIICQEETYLRELVRYIHLNPVRAGIVKTPDELKHYKYTGHSSLMGEVTREWQDTGYVLNYFDKNKKNAINKYEAFVKAGLKDGKKNELTGGGLIRNLGGWTEARDKLKESAHIMSDERILGDSDFVDSIMNQSEEQYDRRQRLRQQGYDVDRITERVAEVLDIDPDEVFIKGRQDWRVKARSLLCYWSPRELGISHTELA